MPRKPPSSWGSRRTTPFPSNWKRLRARVLRRDGCRCQIAGPDCTGEATEVDHCGDGPTDHRLESLQAACSTCHATKTGREANANKPKRRREPEPHPGLIR